MDMYRPIYHFIPGKNWMNDPNGVCWYQGKYHLFYQYNPYSDQWGNIHWGHAVSTDCFHWKILPVALEPSAERGEVHCFSGCVNTEGDQPILYYTSVGREADGRDSRYGAEQWCALSENQMESWSKYEGNPILTKEIHGSLEVLEWRDPFVWREEDGWYMVLGGQIGDSGAVLLYYSSDRLEWKFCRVLLHSSNPAERIFECPNYFALGEKRILVVSPDGMPKYWIGHEGKDHSFIPEKEGIIDHSGWDGFYAPNSFRDECGRRIMIGWLTENGRGNLEIPGWRGVQSLPRELTLENGKLCMRPIRELETLRDEHIREESLVISGTWTSPLRGKAMEVLAEVVKADVEEYLEIVLFADKDGTEETVIRYEKNADRVVIDRTRSNRSRLTDRKQLSCEEIFCEDKNLKLHIFVDYSTVEVFINDCEVISTRAYPDDEKSDEVLLRSKKARIKKLDVYSLKGANIETAENSR